MNKPKILILFSVITTLLFYACVDEDDFALNRLSETTISPEMDANLLKMNFTSQDFFGQISDSAGGVFLIKQEDTLHFQYVKDFTLSGDDLQHDYFNKNVSMHLFDFDFDDIVIPTWYEETFSDDITAIESQTINVDIDAFAKYDENEKARMLDSVILSSGKFEFVANSDLPYDIEVKISSNKIINKTTGKTFNETFIIEKQPNYVNTIDLSNCKMELDAKTDNSSSISLTYSVIVKTAGKKVESGSYALGLKLDGKDLNIDLAYGLIGNPTIPIEGVLDIDYFSDSTIRSDMFELDKLDMQLSVVNYTGIDLFLNLDDLKTRTYTGHTEKLFADGKVLTIAKAISPAQTKTTNAVLPINTKAVTKLPNEFLYYMKSIFGDGSQRGFIAPNKKYLDIHTKIDVPLKLKVHNFVSEKETEALSFLKDDNTVGDYIDSLVLKLSFENSFPAEMVLELFTKDNSGVVSPLLNEPVMVASANIDNNGKVVSATKTNADVFVSTQKYEQLRNADNIIIKATLNSTKIGDKQPYVIFGNDCSLKVKIGAKVNTSIKF